MHQGERLLDHRERKAPPIRDLLDRRPQVAVLVEIADDLFGGDADVRLDDRQADLLVQVVRQRGRGPDEILVPRLLVLLLLDEPFTGIDPIAIAEIQSIVARLKEKGIGVLITDHNVRETLSITDRSYILYGGQILVSGKAHELATNEKAREIYLGEKFSL